MVLHTVGPASMGEDEHKIGNHQTWMVLPLGIAPLLAAQYLDIKWCRHRLRGRIADAT